MKKILLIFPLLLLLGKVGAQTHTITGNVTGEDGEGIPGVNILEKGTISGTVSDVDGNFTIAVKDDADVLVFSFVGFLTDELVIGSRTSISHIMIQDVTMLSEVVVTALGVEREQKTLAYSVSEVEGQELTRSRDPNVMNQLVGRVAGVNVSKTSTVLRAQPEWLFEEIIHW